MTNNHEVWLLDYGAGNVLSVVNAVKQQGVELKVITKPEHFLEANKIIFPGVGSFGACVKALEEKGFLLPLKKYISEGKKLLGICLGMQLLFEGSEESPDVQGLGIIPSIIKKFDNTKVAVPHIGWNGVRLHKNSQILSNEFESKHFYFVHSFRAIPNSNYQDWILATTNYEEFEFVSVVEKDNIIGVQFHPEKSSHIGLKLIRKFIFDEEQTLDSSPFIPSTKTSTQLCKRVIACLDVRGNEHGDLVVTKGDQYDVKHEGNVRNLGKPVELAKRYFDEGADEVTFLNITSFKNCPLTDLPMLEVLKLTSAQVFVPLTIGGGIREIEYEEEYEDENNEKKRRIVVYPALKVAEEYFRSGADKVSIGSDAVFAAEDFYSNGSKKTGKSCIEQINYVYGAQAIVISVDPKRVYLQNENETTHHVVKLSPSNYGPNGEKLCWYQCTVKGGRETRDLDVIQLVTACEILGAGEILLNCIDKDGTNSGFDIDLIREVKNSVKIPVIASSGAGKADHFVQVFEEANVESALAAGIFHRKEVPIQSVKNRLKEANIPVRIE